jgi:hypothetical protein
MYQSRAEYILSLYEQEYDKDPSKKIRHDRTPEEAKKAAERGASAPSNPYKSWGSSSGSGGHNRGKDQSYRRRTAGKHKTDHTRKHYDPDSKGYSRPLSDEEKDIQSKHSPSRERQDKTKARNFARRQAKKERARNRDK